MSESFICRRGGGGATLVITGVAGDTCTISKSGKSKSKTFGNDSKATFKGLDTGTWTVTMTNSSGSTATTTVNITTDYTTSIDYSAIPEYTYSGTSQFVLEDDSENWHLKLLTSGNLNFSKLGNAENIEIFLVGGGGGGGTGGGTGGGAGGGGGGYVNSAEASPTANSSYQVVIGAGGEANSTGGTTSAFGESAAGGESGGIAGNSPEAGNRKGGDGGSGGGAGGWANGVGHDGGTNGGNGNGGESWGETYVGGTGGAVSTIPWGNEATYGRYSGGGGGGNGGKGTASGTEAPGNGGLGGGGRGHGKVSGVWCDAESGEVNTGGGGGGDGGTGGSGIIIIRNKRS